MVSNVVTPGEVISPALFSVSEIRRPWASVFAFPTIAGRLASGEVMLLICRPDELEKSMTDLNRLVTTPASLRRAQSLLRQSVAKKRRELRHLIRLEMTPILSADRITLLRDVEAMLGQRSALDGLGQRLACLLEPNTASRQIQGASRMLRRLQRFDAALSTWSAVGFRATASHRGRHRVGTGEPAQFHLTLHQYAIARQTEAGPATLRENWIDMRA